MAMGVNAAKLCSTLNDLYRSEKGSKKLYIKEKNGQIVDIMAQTQKLVSLDGYSRCKRGDLDKTLKRLLVSCANMDEAAIAQMQKEVSRLNRVFSESTGKGAPLQLCLEELNKMQSQKSIESAQKAKEAAIAKSPKNAKDPEHRQNPTSPAHASAAGKSILNGEGKISRFGFTEEGTFKDDQLHGISKRTFSDGTVFEGEFEKGILQKGKITYPDGSVYKGEFKDGKYSGQGSYAYPVSSIVYYYKGEFADGLPNGVGILEYRDYRVETGTFKNGSLHGEGTRTERLIEGRDEQGKPLFRTHVSTKGNFEYGRVQGKIKTIFDDEDSYEADHVAGNKVSSELSDLHFLRLALGIGYSGGWYGDSYKILLNF